MFLKYIPKRSWHWLKRHWLGDNVYFMLFKPGGPKSHGGQRDNMSEQLKPICIKCENSVTVWKRSLVMMNLPHRLLRSALQRFTVSFSSLSCSVTCFSSLSQPFRKKPQKASVHYLLGSDQQRDTVRGLLGNIVQHLAVKAQDMSFRCWWRTEPEMKFEYMNWQSSGDQRHGSRTNGNIALLPPSVIAQ